MKLYTRAIFPEYIEYGRILEDDEVLREVSGKKVLVPGRLYFILEKLLEYEDYFKNSKKNCKYEVSEYMDDNGEKYTIRHVPFELDNFHDLIHNLKIPYYQWIYEEKDYGTIIQDMKKRFGNKRVIELLDKKLSYVEVFALLTSVSRAYYYEEELIFCFCRNSAYKILLNCKRLRKWVLDYM